MSKKMKLKDLPFLSPFRLVVDGNENIYIRLPILKNNGVDYLVEVVYCLDNKKYQLISINDEIEVTPVHLYVEEIPKKKKELKNFMDLPILTPFKFRGKSSSIYIKIPPVVSKYNGIPCNFYSLDDKTIAMAVPSKVIPIDLIVEEA